MFPLNLDWYARRRSSCCSLECSAASHTHTHTAEWVKTIQLPRAGFTHEMSPSQWMKTIITGWRFRLWRLQYHYPVLRVDFRVLDEPRSHCSGSCLDLVDPPPIPKTQNSLYFYYVDHHYVNNIFFFFLGGAVVGSWIGGGATPKLATHRNKQAAENYKQRCSEL